MNRMKALAALAVAVAVLVPIAAYADGPQYNLGNEVTLGGDVIYAAADHGAASWNSSYVIMKDGHNEIQVYLGPAHFLAEQGVNLKAGDTVRIVGCRSEWKGVELILARTVTASSKTVDLRTPQGEPRW